MTADATPSWSGRRVTVVAAFDSFLRAAVPYARYFESLGAQVHYRIVFARPNQISNEQLRDIGLPPDRTTTIPLDALVRRDAIGGEDVVLLGLDGLRTRRFMVRLHHSFLGAQRRPVVVSFYPGLIFRFHLEGMLSRMSADLLLLNSPADLRLYESALRGMGLTNENALSMGLSFLPSRGEANSHVVPSDGHVLFVGQPTVPAGRTERAYVLSRLAELAEKYPGTEWLLKPRHRRYETTLHRVDHHYEDLRAELSRQRRMPANFRVVHGPMSELLERTRVCLTFSSTAALEAAVRGIPTRVLTDIGIHENVGNHFFLESGLLASFDDVRPDLEQRVVPEWLTEHAATAADQMPLLTERLEALMTRQAREGRSLPRPYDRHFGRSEGFERFLEREEGWVGLANFGERSHGRMARIRRWLTPVSAAFLRNLPGLGRQ